MEEKESRCYHVTHKYKEEIIIPYIGILDNVSYLSDKGERYSIFADGVKAKVVESYEKHICELEDDIKIMYGCDCFTFIKKWYNAYPMMQSMFFVVIKVRKEE